MTRKPRVSTIATAAFSAVLLLSIPAEASQSTDEAAVKATLASYINALQALDAGVARGLFAADSEIIESGGIEGR